MDIYVKIWHALKKTDTIKIIINFIVVCLISSILLKYVDPNIKTFKDGLWYCFVAAYTIGFGDINVTSAAGKIITFIVVVHGMFVFAIMLPEMSKEEIKEVSQTAEKLKNRIYEKSEKSMSKYKK